MGLRMKQWLWIVAMILCFGITGGALRVGASPLPQERHDQDYSRKNKNYKTGMRDGRDDTAHNRDHFKKRKFKKDEDQRAYEAGYDAGRQGGSRDHR
jgi:hypothetical protein